MLNRLLFNHLNIGAFLVVLSLRLGTNPLTISAHSPNPFSYQKLESLSFPIALETKTRFSERIITQAATLPFEIKYENDSEMELGLEAVAQEGQNGTKETDIKIIFFEGEEYDREVIDVRVDSPTPKIIKKGAKKVIREQDTPDGKIRYFLKLKVWATSYDIYCLGCTGRTYTGTPVKQGTIAVDPRAIPLGTRIYVPGYGFGRAEDVGGAIKGKKIDLGFETLAGQWSAHWVDIYLLE